MTDKKSSGFSKRSSTRSTPEDIKSDPQESQDDRNGLTREQVESIFDEYAEDLIRQKVSVMVDAYGFKPHEKDDIAQELRIAVFFNLRKYDAIQASLRTFISRIITRKAANILRDKHRQKRNPNRESFSVNDELIDEDGNCTSISDVMSVDGNDDAGCNSHENQIDLEHDLASVLSRMPEIHRHICERLKEHTVSELAAELGIPRATLYDKYIVPMRDLFDQASLRDYLA